MVTEKPHACKTEHLADRAHIHIKNFTEWKLTPVAGTEGTPNFQFTIAATNRGAGCLRYLGGSGSCSDEYTRLYPSDDGTGLQRWKLVPVGAGAGIASINAGSGAGTADVTLNPACAPSGQLNAIAFVPKNFPGKPVVGTSQCSPVPMVGLSGEQSAVS
jgi:hypothetical protein